MLQIQTNANYYAILAGFIGLKTPMMPSFCVLEALHVVRALGHLEGHDQRNKDSAGCQELEVPHHARLLLGWWGVVLLLMRVENKNKKAMDEYTIQ